LTLVYDIGGEAKRLLAVAEDRTEASLRCCLDSLGKPVCLGVKYVCSDMWRPYLNVIAEMLGQAVTFWTDSMSCNSSAGVGRESERRRPKRLVRDGYEPVLRKVQVVFAKRPENLTEHRL
jgi:transposase